MDKLKMGKSMMFASQVNICIALVLVFTGAFTLIGIIDLMTISPIFMAFLIGWLIQLIFLKMEKNEKIMYVVNTLFQLEVYLFLNPYFGYHNKIVLIVALIIYALVLFIYRKSISKKNITVAGLSIVLVVALLIMLQLA